MIPINLEKDPKTTLRIVTLISATGIGTFMSSVDATITTISLPVIRDKLGVEMHLVQWVILTYLLTLIAFTTIFGDFGDRFGNKRVFQIGLFIFSIGSLLCSLSNTLTFLILSRTLQALGAAATLANCTALITKFTTTENRGTAIGLNTLIVALGVTLGPIIGGLLTDKWGWPSIFLINVPLGILGLIWVQLAIPSTPPSSYDKKGDVLGSISFVLFMFTSIGSLTFFVETNLHNNIMWGFIALSVAIPTFIVFVWWEKRVKNPAIDFKMFKNRKYAYGILVSILAYVGLSVLLFQLPFYLQFKDGMNLTATETGLVILGAPLAMAVVGPISGKLSNKIDARIIATIGLIGIAIALGFFSIVLKSELPMWMFYLTSVIIGASLGAFISPNSNSVMTSAPKEKLGVASGLLNISAQVGFTLGTALSTAVLSVSLIVFQKNNGGELMDVVNYIPSLKVVFWVFVVMVILAAAISYLRGPRDKNALY